MSRKILALLLLLSVAVRADEWQPVNPDVNPDEVCEYEEGDPSVVVDAQDVVGELSDPSLVDGGEVVYKRCCKKRKCFCCLSANNATITTLNVVNETVSGTLTVGGVSVNALLVQRTFAYFYGLGANAIADGTPILFPNAGVASTSPAITYAAGVFTVPEAGNYEVNWTFMPVEVLAGDQFQVFVNGGAVAGTRTGASVANTEISASVIVNVPAATPMTISIVNDSGVLINGTANYIPTISIKRLS